MISVIIPSYNRENTILRSVKSVLAQTYRDIEVIVVDDCSTDQTSEVVQNIRDSRLKYYRLKKNSGACAARNYGIDQARGELIAFQDSDDEWMPEKLEKQMEHLEKSYAEICVCPLWSVDEENGKRELRPINGFNENSFTTEKFLERSLVSTQVILGYRYCFEEERFDTEMPRLQDWDLALRLIQKYKFTYCAEPLVIQYIQKDSISKSSKKAMVAFRNIYTKYEELFKTYPAIQSTMLEKIAMHEWSNGVSSKDTLKRAFYAKPNGRVFFKIVMSFCGLLGIYYKRKYGVEK